MLLRLCWDEADSLGLAGLLLARLSPALQRTENKQRYKHLTEIMSALPAC